MRNRNPQYYQLIKDRHIIGFKRVVTEYLPAGANQWQLEPIGHDESYQLSVLPMGIEGLKRPSLRPKVKSKVERVESG